MNVNDSAQFYKKQFEHRNLESVYWFNKATDLFSSARILWENMNKNFTCWETYKMLMGMSFELLFKAIAIKKEITLRHSHNLIILAKEAGINLSNDEKELLKVLTEYIIWAGKYPTPKDESSLQNAWECENNFIHDAIDCMGIMELSTYNHKLDFKYISEVWRKYVALYISNK